MSSYEDFKNAPGKKTAIITGVTGQDGSHLADLLLEKGYWVVGIKRRTSTAGDWRIKHLYDNPKFYLEQGDITDSGSISRIVRNYKPGEFYNLAAQSFVKASWDEPLHTAEVTGKGVLVCLEAIRNESPSTRFYQASSSEMFGKVQEMPQTEKTPFYPRSPYGCAKVFGFEITRNYRESHNIHASNGILFNHECFFYKTPIILMADDEIDIVYVGEMIASRENVDKDTSTLIKDFSKSNIKIWDGCRFVKLKTVSRKKLNLLESENRKKLISITRVGSVETTPNHKMIDINGNKVKADDCVVGETELKPGEWPPHFSNKQVQESFAFLLGLLAGDGTISRDGKIRLTNNNDEIRDYFSNAAMNIFPNVKFSDYESESGFGGVTTYRQLSGVNSNYGKYLRDILYHPRTKCKKVPREILNSSLNCKRLFLEGYYLADGLKAKACTYEFESFKTNSPLLAQGILYLIQCVTQQTYNVCPEERDGRIYYHINLHTTDASNKGLHLRKNPNELKKQIEISEDNQHVFDIETETGTVMAGVGAIFVGNSPRRGLEFVTRKITDGVAKIHMGLAEHITLGNLGARRDWGHAADYMRAAWLMLQQDQPGDYVVATGKAHSIRQFLDVAFSHIGISDWHGLVKQDPRFMRPAEVDILLGDSSKAREVLGWQPEYSFDKLVAEMVVADIERLSNGVRG